MVVKYKKIFAIPLLMFSLIGCSEAKTEEQIKKENILIDFAHQKLLTTNKEYNLKFDTCRALEKTSQLTAKHLSNFNLTDEDLKTVILYFVMDSLNNCIGKNLDDRYLIQLKQLRYLEEKFDRDVLIDTGSNFETLCCITIQSELESELNYLKLDKEIRIKLEQIKELREPFNGLKILNELGV